MSTHIQRSCKVNNRINYTNLRWPTSVMQLNIFHATKPNFWDTNYYFMAMTNSFSAKENLLSHDKIFLMKKLFVMTKFFLVTKLFYDKTFSLSVNISSISRPFNICLFSYLSPFHSVESTGTMCPQKYTRPSTTINQ